MPTSVQFTRQFNRALGKLGRKFPSVFDAVADLTAQLKQGETPGKPYRRMGGSVYRVRLPNRSARRGKSGGFRAAYYTASKYSVTVLAICDRKDCAELSEANLRAIMRAAGL